MRFVLWCLGTLFLAVIIHIGAVLAIPQMARQTAWQRLFASLEPNTPSVLAPTTPERMLLEQMDPQMIVAVCRYDLTEGPLRLSIPLFRTYWSLSFVTPEKTTIYSINDRTAGDTAAGVFAVSAAEAKRFYAELPDEGSLPLVVEAPQDHGIAVLRVLADLPSQAARYRGLASEYACETES